MSRYLGSKLIAALVFISGLINILSAFYARSPFRLSVLMQIFSLDILNFSRTLTIFTGFLLIVLSQGIFNRKILSWYLTLCLLLASLLLHLIKGLDYEESIFILFSLAALMAFRSEFTVLSGRITGSSRFRLIIYSVLFLAFYSVFGFYLLNHQFNRKVTFVNIMRDYQYSILGTGHNTLIARTRRARWFEGSIPLMAAGVIIVAFSSVFVPADISALILSLKHSDIVKLIHKYGKNGLSYLSIMPDKSLYFSLSGKSFVAYKLVSGVMVILGDPVGPITDSELLVQQLINETQKKGIGLVFFQASEKLIKNYHRHHLRRLRIGYDAVIRLHRFSLEGAPMKNLRNSVSHIEKSDIRFFVYKMSSIPKNIQPQISQLYTGWIESHKDIKMTFSLNFYPFPKTESAYVLVSKDSSGRILSVCSFYPYSNNRAVNLDLMVRASDAPNGLMETAIVKAIKYFKNKKFQYLNLGFAAKHDEARPVSSGLRLFYKYFGTFYNFSSILNFKSKFSPDWQPKYMVYSPNVSLAKILLAILQVHTS